MKRGVFQLDATVASKGRGIAERRERDLGRNGMM